jgi:hypothetical protein
MLQWSVYFKKDQHHKVIKKLCRKIKVEPINCVFELSGHREKLSFCRFEVALKSSSWMEAVSESLEIAYRISPHWHLSMCPQNYFASTCGEGNIEGLEGVISWHLQIDPVDCADTKYSKVDIRKCEQDAPSDGDKHSV